ncbi:efflux transporter outer membrane subunit [Alteromonas sp. D210916BOD_24]|uniref:TolC family protein n=1 Tax=Alteromonas sp. D210916BOD_24 TaxID=3157618 RepID=UPI00399C773E
MLSLPLAMRLVTILVVSMLLMTGCAYSPSTALSNTKTAVFTEQHQALPENTLSTHWWRVFNVAQLEPLMADLERENLNLSQAKMRITRAQALLVQAKAGDMPTLTSRVTGRSGRDFTTGTSSHATSGSVGLSYDADIWGTRAAQQRSRQLGVDAAQYQYTDALLDIQALFISTLLEHISLRARLDIAVQNVQTSDALLKLVQIRFEEGDTSGIEVSQQRNTLISAESEVLKLRNSLTLNERALAALLGKDESLVQSPLFTPVLSLSLSDFTIPDLAPQLTADVLHHRPDIQLAIAQFKQADLAFYEASVAGLPGMSLSADVGVSDLLELAKGWTLGAAISSAATLFDGGRLAAAEQAAKTDVDIAIVQYRQTVIEATQTLLNSHTNLLYQRQNYAYTLASQENNEQLYRLASVRYKAGDTDFLNLLNAQRSYFSARQAVINGYQSVLEAVVSAYRESAGVSIEQEGRSV